MVYRQLSDSLQKKAIEDLNEDPSRIEEYLEHIREWLKKQPHLIIRTDDQSLLIFLRGCKWSLQRTKEKIDYFYTVRTLLPEFFLDRDPFNDEIQKFLIRRVVFPLPKHLGQDGPRIYYYNYGNIDFDNMPLMFLFKVLLMSVDLLLHEDDNLIISGFVLVVNGGHMPLSCLLQFTPTLVKKLTLCFQHAYPLRIKSVVVMNTNPALEKMYVNICKPLLNEKLKSRIHMYTARDTEKVYNHIPKSLLPEEYGGNNGSCEKLADEWRKKLEIHRKWFIEDSKYCSNEKLRPGTPRTYDEEFNMEGTFRKLTID